MCTSSRVEIGKAVADMLNAHAAVEALRGKKTIDQRFKATANNYTGAVTLQYENDWGYESGTYTITIKEGK